MYPTTENICHSHLHIEILKFIVRHQGKHLRVLFLAGCIFLPFYNSFLDNITGDVAEAKKSQLPKCYAIFISILLICRAETDTAFSDPWTQWIFP